MFAWVALLFVVFILVHWLVIWRTTARDGMPGPVPIPLFGNTLFALRHLRTIHHHLFKDKYASYGPIARVWLVGMLPVYIVNDPDAVHQILIKHQQVYDRSSLEQKSLARMLEGGLLMLNNGEEWKHSRAILGTAFHRRPLKNMFPLFEQRAKLLIKNLEQFAESGQIVDMQTEFQKLTFDIIGLVSMGIDFGSQKTKDNEYEKAWESVLTQLMFQFYFPLPQWVWRWLMFIPRVRKSHYGIKLLESAIQQAIELRKQHPFTDEDGDLLSIMIKHQQDSERAGNADIFVDKKINRELLTFMFAGHDTTRSTLCWLLYYISENKDVEERVMEEINEFCASENIIPEMIQQCKYLRCVLNETLRLRPPAPVRGRTLTQEDEILGYHLPKGSHVTWSPYSLHRKESVWENAFQFDPSRFEGEKSRQASQCAFVPFGAGVRRCIGEQMAVNEILVAMVLILKQYSFKLKPSIEIEDEWALTLSMKQGLPVFVSKRHKK